MFEYILFDLDGTLTDNSEGITKSIAYSFEHFGYPVESLEALQVYIGPPLESEFMKRLGVDQERSIAVYRKFQERYNREGWCENVVLPGMAEALRQLKAAGRKLAVATSKPERAARRILELFELAPYFEVIRGSNPDGSNGDKAMIVRYVLDVLGVTEENRHLAVMVGDRAHDVVGGRKNGLATVGVTFGFGSRQELEESGVSFVADTAEEMTAYLLSE